MTDFSVLSIAVDYSPRSFGVGVDYKPLGRAREVTLGKINRNFLFNAIAPIYDLFYYKQKKRFAAILEGVRNELDLTDYITILDVGCGTGALCSVLSSKGLLVTGIDPAVNMLNAS